MKKHILLLICISMLTTLLYGCSSNTRETAQYDTPLYSIAVEDGQYNLTPKVTTSDVDGSRALLYPKFTSLDEMRQSIITGSLAEYELEALSYNSQSTEGEIEICDLDHLYEYTAPAEFTLEYIMLFGKSYQFLLSCEKVWGGIYCYNEKEYTEKYNRGYKKFLSNPLVTLIEQEEIDDRSATVYHCNTDVAKKKYICYEICVGNKKMFIQEEYLLECDNDRLKVSSDVPSTIYFWGEEQSSYFYGVFFDFSERPSVEWLCQFGLTPYV